jgi:hypothetical protein
MNFICHRSIPLLMITAGTLTLAPAQQTTSSTTDDIEPAAMEALTKMGAHLRSLKAFEVGADITSEVVLDDGQKIQFAQKVNILTRLPDKLLAEVDGDLAKRLYVYDGKSFTLLAARAGYFATTTAPSTLSQLVDILEDKYNIEIPLADLFRWGGPKASTNRISSALDVGPAQVGGVSCRQYAYRQPGIDWQVWIQRGDYPLPRKIVVTTTTDEARPQYTSILTWNLAPAYNDAAFDFAPPPGAHKVAFAEDKALEKN